MTLDEIGKSFGTDKSSLAHCYLPFYELLFGQFFREGAIKLLEIGVQFGLSSRTWRNYFQNASIVGIDSVNNGPDSKTGLTKFILGDAYNMLTVGDLAINYRFDIIIDDGSHAKADQEFVAKAYPHLLTQAGILIIEDVPRMEFIPDLARAIPEGFFHAAVDLRTAQTNTHDSILFLVWRK